MKNIKSLFKAILRRFKPVCHKMDYWSHSKEKDKILGAIIAQTKDFDTNS